VVNVVPEARGCLQYMSGLAGYAAEGATAMVARELSAVPAVELDGELTVRRARVTPTGEDVELARAAAACILADPGAAELSEDVFVAYLSSIPNAEFFAAVDRGGTVRATAGVAVFGHDARIFFVSTDPAWRGRGIGTAMTAAALLCARERGASRAGLDASPAGRAIYAWLGFEAAAELTMFARMD
jgi:GNAT superfamily N-acetyltransferase